MTEDELKAIEGSALLDKRNEERTLGKGVVTYQTERILALVAEVRRLRGWIAFFHDAARWVNDFSKLVRVKGAQALQGDALPKVDVEAIATQFSGRSAEVERAMSGGLSRERFDSYARGECGTVVADADRPLFRCKRTYNHDGPCSPRKD